MKKNIWSLRESVNYEKEGFGYAESPNFVDSLWIYQGTPLKEDEEDKEWKTPLFQMPYGNFPDYLDNDCSWPLCSEKIRSCIDNNINGKKNIRWLPINVINGETTQIFFALLIETHLNFKEVVDYEKSKKLRDGSIYLPHFIYDKVADIDLFALEDRANSVFISENLKDILEKENFKGLGFEDWKAS